MPVNLIENPLALFGETPAVGSIQTITAQTAAVLQNGQGVQLAAVSAGGTPQVTILGTAATNYIVGIATNAPTGGYQIGALVTVVIEGLIQATFAAATTAGQYVIQSGTAGSLATTGTAPAVGQGLGICLQTIAGAGTAWIYVCKM
jgi:hypothetical protein